MSVEHRDLYENTVDRDAYERAHDAELDQREWEQDDTRMIPKPPMRFKASKKDWQTLRENFAGLACWVCGDAWTDLHHIVPRSRSGDDVYANLAPLCRACHARVEARDAQARAGVRAAMDARHSSYLQYRIGETWEGWLDRHYAPLKVAA